MLGTRPVVYTITDNTTNESNAKPFTSWFSLIWTLRFNEAGDFELKTHDVELALLHFPLFAIVFLNDDYPMMMVENHDIVGSADGDVLTVSGRTLEAAWFSGRKTVHEHEANYQLWNSSQTPQAFLANSLMLGSAVSAQGEPLAYSTYAIDSSANDLYSSFVPYTTERTDVYTEITKMCKTFGLGVRSERPSTDENKMRFLIYGQQNRTGQIRLHSKLGHFDPKTRLYISIKDEFHEVQVLGETNSRLHADYPEYSGMTDYRRRQAVVWNPQVPDGASVISFYDQYIRDFMKTHTREYLYECSLSPHGLNVIKEMYTSLGLWNNNTVLGDLLGDIVTVSPKYHNGTIKMRIEEFTRSFGYEGAKDHLTLKQIV